MEQSALGSAPRRLTYRGGAPGLPSYLQALKANGPLAITIWADSNPSIQFYKGGVYSHPDSPLAGEDHAITLVGWGEEKMVNGTIVPFWIIINSWGNTWWVEGGRGVAARRVPATNAVSSAEDRSLPAGARRATCA